MGDAFDFDAFYRELQNSASLSKSSDSLPPSSCDQAFTPPSPLSNPTFNVAPPTFTHPNTNPTFTTSTLNIPPAATTFPPPNSNPDITAPSNPTFTNPTPPNPTFTTYSSPPTQTTSNSTNGFTFNLTYTIPARTQTTSIFSGTFQSTPSAPTTPATLATPTTPQTTFTTSTAVPSTPTKPQTTSTTSFTSTKPQTNFTSPSSHPTNGKNGTAGLHTSNGSRALPSASNPPIPPPPLYTTSVKFSDLALKDELVNGMKENGYIQCSSVQKECLPVALEGKNVVCKATPGVGKTLIFVVTILQKLQDKSEVQAVVLANTAELVSQIYNELQKVGTYLDYLHLLSYHEYNRPESFRLANVIVGTPAKVRSVIPKMAVSPNCILALDEADRVRYKDELVHIREIFNMLGNQKQVIITATAMDDETDILFKKLVPAPSHWLNLQDTTLMAESLIHTYQLVDNVDEKCKKLLGILSNVAFNQMVIFANHKTTVIKLVAFLRKHEYNVIEMSSDRSFEDRLKDIAQFKKFQTRLMVSTDMLSRGIDIKYVNIVLNFDMAQRTDTYLRRVGRAARFGKKGLAISFLESHADVVMRKEVENRFNVKFKTLSLQIEPKTYMNKVNEAEL